MTKANGKSKKASTISNSYEQLFNRIACDTGLIFADTPEESRLISQVFTKFPGHSVQFWSSSQGLIKVPDDEDPLKLHPYKYDPKSARSDKDGNSSRLNIMNTLRIIEDDSREKIKNKSLSKKTIYILRDADKYFAQPVPLRYFRDVIYLASSAASCIILTGFGIKVPPDLETDSTYIKIDYPKLEEIKETILPQVKRKIELAAKMQEHNSKKKTIDPEFDMDGVARACAGLTWEQILNAMSYSTTVKKKVDVPTILDEKKQIINKSDILDYMVCSESLSDVGGHDKLKEWFNIQKIVLNNAENAEEFCAQQPKGIMLLGVQGSGKSFVAQSVAQDWNVGLIKLNMGKVFGGLVGQSESNMRRALAQMDAAAPVVVLIDELDKGLSGAGSSDKTDGGTTSRVIGTLLEWLQTPHSGVFLVTTANDITNLRNNHPELLRKGRFDEIWFSDVPTFEERKEIFSIHLRKRDRDPETFDLDKLASKKFKAEDTDKDYNYTGAEIEYAIVSAIKQAFARSGGKKIKIGSKDDVTSNDIIDKLDRIKPITFISRDVITQMRKWSRAHAEPTSSLLDTLKNDSMEDREGFNMRDMISDDLDI